MSAVPGVDSRTIARRTKVFLDAVAKVWNDCGGPMPTAVRSYGDGLFCVWELPDENDHAPMLRTEVLRCALGLASALPLILEASGDYPLGTQLGLGLASGDASAAKLANDDSSVTELGSAEASVPQLSEVRDYYGYVVNLASKLQNFARPHGLVVHPNMVSSPEDLGLEERYFDIGLGADVEKYYATSHVQEHNKWTCLAWPGFARTLKESGRPGLNMHGITVLTHEGLQGKIDSLEIWPRNDPRDDKGDSFELIIDDFDGLGEMLELEDIQLYRRRYRRKGKFNSTIEALVSGTANFYFIPIRCGLNAVAWNIAVDCKVAKVADVKAITDQAEYLKIGLYDNMGASLPMLIQAIYERERIFLQDEELLGKLIQYLSQLQAEIQKTDGPNFKLFQLYSKIEDLGFALQNGTEVQVVLGGGAWLTNPQTTDSPSVRVGLPGEKMLGMVWIEGAAVVGAQPPDDHLEKFLEQHLLNDEYQKGLLIGPGYGCCPVTKSALTELIKQDAELGSFSSGARQTVEEARAIFQPNGLLAPRLLMRQTPKKVVEWRRAWETIRTKFCDIHSGRLNGASR